MSAERSTEILAFDDPRPCEACANRHYYLDLSRGLCRACRATVPHCIACRVPVGPRGCACHLCPTEGCETITPNRFCRDCSAQEHERRVIMADFWRPMGADGPTLPRRDEDEDGYIPGIDPGHTDNPRRTHATFR